MNRWDALAAHLGCPIIKATPQPSGSTTPGFPRTGPNATPNQVKTDVPAVDSPSQRKQPAKSKLYRFSRPAQPPAPTGGAQASPSPMPQGYAIGSTNGSLGKHRLTAAERNALPSSAFADPKNRRFPMNDPSHARLAVAMADRGHAGTKVKAKIKRKAKAAGVGAPSLEKSLLPKWKRQRPPGSEKLGRKRRGDKALTKPECGG